MGKGNQKQDNKVTKDERKEFEEAKAGLVTESEQLVSFKEEFEAEKSEFQLEKEAFESEKEEFEKTVLGWKPDPDDEGSPSQNASLSELVSHSVVTNEGLLIHPEIKDAGFSGETAHSKAYSRIHSAVVRLKEAKEILSQ